jgi:hypothetical protein
VLDRFGADQTFFLELLHIAQHVVERRIQSRRSGFLLSKATLVIFEDGLVSVTVTAGETSAGLAKLLEITSKSLKLGSEIASAHVASSDMITPSQSSCR